MLTTKSVNSAIDPEGDGLRILATRFRGRGMPASRYDVWMPSLGPSERLLKSVQTGKITWAEFAREYRAEMFMDGPIDARSRTIKNHGQKFTLRLIEQLSRNAPVTLLCAIAPRSSSTATGICSARSFSTAASESQIAILKRWNSTTQRLNPSMAAI